MSKLAIMKSVNKPSCGGLWLFMIILVVSSVEATTSQESSPLTSPYSGGEDSSAKCFCQLQGRIDDCSCSVDTVDHFNNMKIHPRLMSLLLKPYFRYFKYNPNKGCPFWDDAAGKCATENCHVRSCSDEEIPPGLKDNNHPPSNHNKYSEAAQNGDSCESGNKDTDDLNGKVDSTISDETMADLVEWQAHDSSQADFCEVDAELCPDCQFVDLSLNPERYTGYSGEASRRIWRAIYEENCFRPPGGKTGAFSEAFFQDSLEDLCLEKRAFYRAVSGLHASITIHLTANYLRKNGDAPFLSAQGAFGPNAEEFERRFDPSQTNGQGPYWLKNLYFVYLLELRALTKVAPYLETQTFFTGKEDEDKETQIAVKELLNLLRSFPDQFDESVMFSNGGGGKSGAALKHEFREHFRNISRIMDCVGCDKCKLWGKLQITGLGTALKILFAGDDDDAGTAMSNQF